MNDQSFDTRSNFKSFFLERMDKKEQRVYFMLWTLKLRVEKENSVRRIRTQTFETGLYQNVFSA